MARLSKREWDNKALTEYTKIKPAFSVPYSRGVNPGATIKRQKCWLNTFHMLCFKSILNISWQDHIPKHVFPVVLTSPLIAGSCLSHGGREVAKRHFLWTADHWRQKSWLPPCSISRMPVGETWKPVTSDQSDGSSWPQIGMPGVRLSIRAALMQMRGQLAAEKRIQRRHVAATSVNHASPFVCKKCGSDRLSWIRLKSYSILCHDP